MIKTDYVETLIGGSDYLASILAILCFEKKSSIGLLRGPHFFQDPSFLSRISSLEFHYLKALGEHYRIAPLLNLHSYIIQSPYTLRSEGETLLLGRGVRANINELQRKKPELFQEGLILEDLDFSDSEHGEYLEKIAYNIFKLSGIHKIREATFIDDRSYFKKFFKIFTKKVLKSEEGGAFLRASMSLFENFIPARMDCLYIYYQLLNLVSPYYLLDIERLDEDLVRYYRGRGGLVLNDQIEDFVLAGNSFEGVKLYDFGKSFHFEDFCGLGHLNEVFPLVINTTGDYYESIDFILEPMLRFPPPLGLLHNVTRKEWLGSSIQSLVIQPFQDRILASFTVSPSLRSQQWGETCIPYLQGELEKELRLLGFKGKLPITPHLVNSISKKFREQSPRTLKRALKKEERVSYAWRNNPKRVFQNSQYFGQYSKEPLGKVSLLFQMQRFL